MTTSDSYSEQLTGDEGRAEMAETKQQTCLQYYCLDCLAQCFNPALWEKESEA